MSRLFSLVGVVAIILTLAPMIAVAQNERELYGQGEKASDEIRDGAVAYVEQYAEAVGRGDGSAADLQSQAIWGQIADGTRAGAVDFYVNFAFPVEIVTARDVRIHETGHISVMVIYSGLFQPAEFLVQRWYLVSNGTGGYILDDVELLKLRVPSGLDGAELSVTLNDDGLTASETDLPAVDVVLIEVETESSNMLTTGIYRLDDQSAEEAQAEFVAGNYEAIEFLGGTPVEPGTTFEYGFLVEPGEVYLIQQFTLDADRSNVQVLEGQSYATTFAVRA